MNALIAAWSLRSFCHGFAVGGGRHVGGLPPHALHHCPLRRLERAGTAVLRPFHAAGGLFFIYLAYKIGTAKPPQESSADEEHPLRGYLLGLSRGLVNPYQVDLWRR